MAYVSVPKDLTKVKTKIALNLTKRQLIGFALAGAIGFPVYLLSRKFLPNDLSMLLMITAAFPIIFSTLYEKDGLYLEKYIKYYLEKKRHTSIRIYQTDCIYDLKAKGGKIEQKRNKAKEKTLTK